jgi:hypothetical protein
MSMLVPDKYHYRRLVPPQMSLPYEPGLSCSDNFLALIGATKLAMQTLSKGRNRPQPQTTFVRCMEPSTAALGYIAMPDFPIDPEVRIRATPSIVLRRTTEAVDFIRKVALSSSDRAWRDLLQNFEAARGEWSAMEAVVKLELLLEAEGLLVEQETADSSRSAEARSRAA